MLIHRLHPFSYDAATVDPKEIASRSQEEYEVQETLDHRDKASRYLKKTNKRKAQDKTVTSRKCRKPATDPASDVLPSDVTKR